MSFLKLLYGFPDSRKTLLLIFALLGIFLFSFNLKNSQMFEFDSARDIFEAYKIWESKDLRLLGPPASVGASSQKIIFFGSAHLYIGLLGLLALNFNPLGAVIPNIFFFSLSVPLFFLLALEFTRDNKKSFILTLIYLFSPVVVYHSRFFWNPNLIIPLSVLFWFLVTKKFNNFWDNLKYLLAGLVAALCANLHFSAIFPIFGVIIAFSFDKKIKAVFELLAGLFVGLFPFVIFELKNQFYLTSAIFYNLTNGKDAQPHTLQNYLGNFSDIFLYLFGFRPVENYFSTFVYPGFVLGMIMALAFLGLLIFSLKCKTKFWPVLPALIISFALTLISSAGDTLQIRLMFFVLPVLIIALFAQIPAKLYPLLIILLLIQVYASFSVINFNPFSRGYLSLEDIEKISSAIIADNPSGKYNITQNLSSDSRAIPFRYYVYKALKIKPQDETHYQNLGTLYVISSEEDIIYREGRWEFTASGKKQLEWQKKFGKESLFKFEIN